MGCSYRLLPLLYGLIASIVALVNEILIHVGKDSLSDTFTEKYALLSILVYGVYTFISFLFISYVFGFYNEFNDPRVYDNVPLYDFAYRLCFVLRLVCGAFLIAAGLLGISGWYWKMALIGVGGYLLLLLTFAVNQRIVRNKKKK